MPSRRLDEDDDDEEPLFANPLPRSTSSNRQHRSQRHAGNAASTHAASGSTTGSFSSRREARAARDNKPRQNTAQRAANRAVSAADTAAAADGMHEPRPPWDAETASNQTSQQQPGRRHDIEMGRELNGDSAVGKPMLGGFAQLSTDPDPDPDAYLVSSHAAGHPEQAQQGFGHDHPDHHKQDVTVMSEEALMSEHMSRVVWKYTMFILAVGPWKLVRGLAYVINRWQRVCRPISQAVYYTSDLMDKHIPTVRNTAIWLWGLISLGLHIFSVAATFIIIHILYVNKHNSFATAMVLLYCLSHYLMGVIMYFEMDRVKTRMGKYAAHDFVELASRQLQVAFWDVQLTASLIHSNFMIEGLTQMVLKGYEEARVCLHALVNTFPACIMLGLLYDPAIKIPLDDLESIDIIHVYGHQIYAALALSILNTLDKIVRFSLADPWMHAKLDDGYPLVYMRSNAARIPHGLVLNWLFRCKTQLQETDGELRLRELFSVYTFSSKGQTRELSDGQKAYLIKKVFRTFNAKKRLHKAEALARQLDHVVTRDKAKYRSKRNIVSLNANRINLSPEFSGMLGEVFLEAQGFSTLLLSGSDMDDSSLAALLDGVKRNARLQLEELDLSHNKLGQKGCDVVAQYMAARGSLHTLNLSGNPVTDAGARSLAEAIVRSIALQQLDLSNTTLGPEAGAALGAMLRSNTALKQLNLSGTALGSSGLEQLSKGLRSNTGLQELDVSRTGLDDRACAGFAQAIAVNRVLACLNLSGTQVGDAGAKLLVDALQQNTVLKQIDLTDTPMDRSWVKLIANIVGTRPGQ